MLMLFPTHTSTSWLELPFAFTFAPSVEVMYLFPPQMSEESVKVDWLSSRAL